MEQISIKIGVKEVLHRGKVIFFVSYADGRKYEHAKFTMEKIKGSNFFLAADK